MPYDIEGETLTMPEILARCTHDTQGRRLNPKTVQNRVAVRKRKTWAGLREPVAIGRLRGKDNYRGWTIGEKPNAARG